MRSRWMHPGTALGALALLVAIGGTAVAAQHYLITNVRQISPTVRSALRGRTGARGPRGATGLRGPAGINGVNGHDGVPGPRGPSDVHQSFFDGPNSIPANTSNFQAIFDALQTFDKAKYVAIAKLSITPSGTGEVSCTLQNYGAAPFVADSSYVQGNGVEQTITMTIAGADFASATGPFGFVVYCNTPLGTSASYKSAKITAIETANATVAGG